jgi:hypothetical protein
LANILGWEGCSPPIFENEDLIKVDAHVECLTDFLVKNWFEMGRFHKPNENEGGSKQEPTGLVL